MIAVPVNLQSFLAFDYGQKRTGVAVGNRFTRTATPQGTINAEGDARFIPIAARVKEWQPDAIVVGVPFLDAGGDGDEARIAFGVDRALRGGGCLLYTSPSPRD